MNIGFRTTAATNGTTADCSYGHLSRAQRWKNSPGADSQNRAPTASDVRQLPDALVPAALHPAAAATVTSKKKKQ